jgi:hypothetical protein
MSSNPPSLDSFYPPWTAISDKYELLFDTLKARPGNPAYHREKEAGLFWEHFGFELVVTLLVRQGIRFETGVQDVQPVIQDVHGVNKEVDFRIQICDVPVIFGVTHFCGHPKDLRKDVQQENTPVHGIRQNGVLVADRGTILSTRSQKEYLNRRIAVRIASEGKTRFPHDYIYILFPVLDIGFGGGLDAIPLEFQFDRDSTYKYRPIGMTAVILIGQHIETQSRTMTISGDKLIVRTLPFDSCSAQISHILHTMDGTIIDMTKRNRQIREILAGNG